MDSFGDIVKCNNNFDETLETTISRYHRRYGKKPKLLITESVNLAALYDSSDGLVQTESWIFPQLNRLQFPAVIAKDTTDGNDYLWAVQEPNSLTKWSFGKNKSRVCKHFFNVKISGLIVFDDKPMEPIVVYDKGFCQSISAAIRTKAEEKKREIISKDECIQFIDGLVDNKTNDLIIYLITKSVKSKTNSIKSVYKLRLNAEKNTIAKINSQSVVNSFTNWTLFHKSSAVLSVNQLNNKLVLFSLNGETETQLLELTSSSITSLVSVCATAGGSVCLIGKTQNSNFVLELWEMRYGSRLAQMELPFKPMDNDSKVIANTLLITCFKGIVLVPIKNESISLSQMIDRIKAKKPIAESNLDYELNQIFSDLNSNSTDSWNDINERFKNVVQQRNRMISEELILKMVIICSSKLSETNNQSLRPFFETLLSLPFNELFMISRVKSLKLNFTQISSILKLLTEILSLNNCTIIDWISILIDSHINLFFVNPNEETVSLIEEIERKVEELGYFYEQLGEIKTLFEVICAKSQSKPIGFDLPTPKRGEYCIELLRF